MATDKTRKNIYLPKQEAHFIREAAAEWGVSESEVVRRALKLLAEKEDLVADPMERFIGSASYPVGKRGGARYVDDIYRT